MRAGPTGVHDRFFGRLRFTGGLMESASGLNCSADCPGSAGNGVACHRDEVRESGREGPPRMVTDQYLGRKS